jgi:hypothetical protein
MTNRDTTAAPLTKALQRVLATPMHRSAIADLLFLEAWERDPSDHAGVALRIGQIRRANPALAAEIRAEVALLRHASIQVSNLVKMSHN